MINDLKGFLWLLKFGVLVNLYFLGQTFIPLLDSVSANILFPARILFIVSAFRCLFPVRYKDNVVFHNSPLSSVFLTRLFATFSEIALIYLFAYVLRLLNISRVGWVDVLSWLMVTQVVVSQCFVWGSILTGQLRLFFYEELGWALIYTLNTIASVYLLLAQDNLGDRELLLQLNLLFGLIYLPWQFFHLRALRADTIQAESLPKAANPISRKSILLQGLHQAIHVKNQTSEARLWGGISQDGITQNGSRSTGWGELFL